MTAKRKINCEKLVKKKDEKLKLVKINADKTCEKT